MHFSCHCYLSYHNIIKLPYILTSMLLLFFFFFLFLPGLWMGLERNPSWPWGRTPLCCQRPWENGQKQVLLWKSTFSIIKIDSHTDQHSFFLCSTTMWLWVWLWTNWLQIVLPSNHIPLLFSILIRALMLGKMTVLHVWLTGIYGKTDMKGYSWIIPLHQNVKITGGP